MKNLWLTILFTLPYYSNYTISNLFSCDLQLRDSIAFDIGFSPKKAVKTTKADENKVSRLIRMFEISESGTTPRKHSTPKSGKRKISMQDKRPAKKFASISGLNDEVFYTPKVNMKTAPKTPIRDLGRKISTLLGSAKTNKIRPKVT